MKQKMAIFSHLLFHLKHQNSCITYLPAIS